MSLDALVIEDFRCVARAELELDSRCNLVSGANASGKTSLLEAIFVLGRGRSFRTARTEILIRNGTEAFTLASAKLPIKTRFATRFAEEKAS